MWAFRASTILTRARRLLADIVLSAAAFATVIILPMLQSTYLHGSAYLLPLGKYLALYAGMSAVALVISRTYRMIWRYVGFRDMLVLIQAATLSVLGFVFIEFLLQELNGSVSGSLFLTVSLVWAVHVGFLAAPRLIARAYSERGVLGPLARSQDRALSSQVLIMGDDERIEAFIRHCDRDRNSRCRVIGVLSETKQFQNSYFHGVQILGGIDELVSIVANLADRGIYPKTLIVARDAVPRKELERLLEQATLANLKIARLPHPSPSQENKPLRHIDLADLLGRPEIQLDAAAVAAMIVNRRVLVTGAGGSIGSELTRQLARFKPTRLIVSDSCEFNLYSISQELSEKFPELAFTSVLLDVRDAGLVTHWIEKVKPHIVFHAAALKHVPLLEDNPIEAVKTNVLGTANVAEACVRCGVEAMVTISTDKAVNPSNIMGATKRLAEAYCQGLDQSEGVSPAAKTRFVTVRFGNVLGSAGSVVPLFQRQIEAGGPITLTHPDINRYFMTISEAVILVLQAGAQGIERDDERGSIYLLDMGQPMKIIDLARQMIRLSGFRPDIDIEIKVVGLRPGEKLYEEVMHGDEEIIPTQNKLVLKIAPRATDPRIIRQQIYELQQACSQREVGRVTRLLQVSVPEYVSDERQAV